MFSFLNRCDNNKHDNNRLCDIVRVRQYDYLDGLQARFPNLTIGGCAGGGREADIEAYRRTQMNSRADGYCAGDQLCAQGETYSLSLWLPRHGSSQATIDTGDKKSQPRDTSNTAYSFHSFMSMSMAFEYGETHP